MHRGHTSHPLCCRTSWEQANDALRGLINVGVAGVWLFLAALPIVWVIVWLAHRIDQMPAVVEPLVYLAGVGLTFLAICWANRRWPASPRQADDDDLLELSFEEWRARANRRD